MSGGVRQTFFLMNPALLSESVWAELLGGGARPEVEFGPLRAALDRLRACPSPGGAAADESRRELADLFARHSEEPALRRDWERLVASGGFRPGALCRVEDVAARIRAGARLLLAGERALLARLPPGDWIGGTIPYFMTPDGGCMSTEWLCVTELPECAFEVSTRVHGLEELEGVYAEDEDVVGVLILPHGSAVHESFALNAPEYRGFAGRPLLGWVAGVRLDRVGVERPACFCGGPEPLEDRAVELRFRLPGRMRARIELMNLFEQGDGEVLCFPDTGMVAREVVAGGARRVLADYLVEAGIDVRLPLVTEWRGTWVNVSVKRVDRERGEVEFYAPVRAGAEYRWARPMADYTRAFEARAGDLSREGVVFSCNCILNYIYSGLEGRGQGLPPGPMAFGEIGYQLLNQTWVSLVVEERRGGG